MSIKFYWSIANLICLDIVCGYFCSTGVELKVAREHMVREVQNIYGFFAESLPNSDLDKRKVL